MLGTDAAGLAAGPFVASCSLLAIAGVAKAANPRPTRDAIGVTGWRVPAAAMTGFGVIEVGVGLAGLVAGGRAALAVAACYIVLAVVAWRLVRRAPTTPCACLGAASSAPASRVHVLVNIGAVGVALAAATGGSPFAGLADHPFEGLVFVALVMCCIALVALAFNSLAALDRTMTAARS